MIRTIKYDSTDRAILNAFREGVENYVRNGKCRSVGIQADNAATLWCSFQSAVKRLPDRRIAPVGRITY